MVKYKKGTLLINHGMTIQEAVKWISGSVITDARIEQAIIDCYRTIFTHFRFIINSIDLHRDAINQENIQGKNYPVRIQGLLAVINQAVNDAEAAKGLPKNKFSELIKTATTLSRRLKEFRAQLLKPVSENILIHYKLV